MTSPKLTRNSLISLTGTVALDLSLEVRDPDFYNVVISTARLCVYRKGTIPKNECARSFTYLFACSTFSLLVETVLDFDT